MKRYTHSTKTELDPHDLWKVFSDLEHWNTWDSGLDSTRWIDKTARIFELKPKGGGAVKIHVSAYEEGRLWTDQTKFPLAVLEGEHLFLPLPEGGTEVRTTMTVKGPLAWLWNKIVVQGIAAGQEEQTSALIDRAKSLKIGG